MKIRTFSTCIGSGLLVAAVAVFSHPGLGSAFSTIGGSLGVATTGSGYQRDIRVFNNAADTAANNNTTPDAAYPGTLGAAMALWKGGVAWSSHTAGAGKNFDVDWQGAATGAGGTNGNTVGWTDAGCGGGTLAYTETPISDGWRINMCESGITWADGPGSIGGSQYDIQAVMAHEYGHALGLGHTGVGCGTCNATTMCPFICNGNISQRTIDPDDAAGLEFIYGAIAAGKPLITSLGGANHIGGTLVINGSGFDANVSVKFSAGTSANTNMDGVVAASSTGGGTQISVVIPATALTGNVLVWEPPSRLSNAFPIVIDPAPPPDPWVDLGGGTSGINGPPTLNMSGPLTPSSTLGLDLVSGPPAALAVLYISFSSTPAAFLGGTLHAFPIAELLVIGTDGAGEIHGAVTFGGAPSGTQLWFQLAFADASVPVYGASLSNAERGTVP